MSTALNVLMLTIPALLGGRYRSKDIPSLPLCLDEPERLRLLQSMGPDRYALFASVADSEASQRGRAGDRPSLDDETRKELRRQMGDAKYALFTGALRAKPPSGLLNEEQHPPVGPIWSEVHGKQARPHMDTDSRGHSLFDTFKVVQGDAGGLDMRGWHAAHPAGDERDLRKQSRNLRSRLAEADAAKRSKSPKKEEERGAAAKAQAAKLKKESPAAGPRAEEARRKALAALAAPKSVLSKKEQVEIVEAALAARAEQQSDMRAWMSGSGSPNQGAPAGRPGTVAIEPSPSRYIFESVWDKGQLPQYHRDPSTGFAVDTQKQPLKPGPEMPSFEAWFETYGSDGKGKGGNRPGRSAPRAQSAVRGSLDSPPQAMQMWR